MFNKLPFICGGFKHRIPNIEILPSNTEPYRVGWDPISQNNDRAAYVVPGTKPGYLSGIRSLYVLTDYAPITDPVINVVEQDPFNTDIFGLPVIASANQSDGRAPFSIPNVEMFAHPDRRSFSEDKIFMTRLFFNGLFEQSWLMRYNLGDGSYIGICAEKVIGGQGTCWIRYVDAAGQISDSPKANISLDSMTSLTELRLVLGRTTARMFFSEPGTLGATLVLPAPLKLYRGNSFDLFGPSMSPNILSYGIGTLHIYSGSM